MPAGYYDIPWMHLHSGYYVTRADDPRHVGRIRAVFNSATAKVVWLNTGWVSEEPLAELVRYRATDL